MHTPIKGHLVEVADVSHVVLAVGERRLATNIGKASQDMHELHGPRSESFLHYKTREKAATFRGTGSGSTEHHDCRGIKALISGVITKLLNIRVIQPHVLPIDNHHR